MREGSPPIGDLLDQFLGDLAANGQLGTARTYRSLLRTLPDTLTEPVCRQLIADRSHQSRNTAHTFAAALGSFCKYLVDMGYLIESPMRRVRKPRAGKGREHGRYLSSDEIARVWASCEENDYLIVLLLLTGLRASELVNLKWSDISGDTARIRGQGDRIRYVYLDPRTVSLLGSGSGLVYGGSYKNLFRQIGKLGKRAGIRLHPHLFRHTAFTHMAMAGMDESAMLALGGWTNPNMLRNTYAVRG